MLRSLLCYEMCIRDRIDTTEMNQNVVKEQIVKWIVDDFKPTAIDTDVDWIAAMEG